MNLIKLLDTKLIYWNQLHFYALTTKYQKEKLRKQSHLPSHQKEIINRNKPKETKDLCSKKTIRRWWKKLKITKTLFFYLKDPILLKWPYYTGSLQIECNPYQTINGIFSQNWNQKKYFLTCMKTQKDSQNNPEKEWSLRDHAPWL